MTTEKIKQFLLDTYERTEIEDITRHGCSGGIRGFIYYTETTAFHDEHEAEIWDMLYEDAQDQGVTILDLVASFGGSKDIGSMAQFKNLLCWYAVERTAYELVDNIEVE